MSNTFNTEKNEIGVRVYIGNKQVADWLPYFESKKEIIENKIGSKLDWNPNPDNRDKVITLTKQFDLQDENNWIGAIQWLVGETIKFKETFSKMIKEKTA